jgi:hypothetical protein
MAIEYTLDIADDIEPDRLLRLVEAELGLDHDRDSEANNAEIVGRDAPGFYITALPVDPMSAEIAGEWLGFKPTVRVMFRIDKDGDRRAAHQRVLRATSGVLTRLPGDSALILNGEHVELLRRRGLVIVNVDPRAFDAEALAEIRVPYTRGDVPAP